MKHIYFFSSILACGIILLVLGSFIFKGVPKDLTISKESVTEYQQEKEELCDTNDGTIDYDYNFKFSKTATNDTDQVTSIKGGFSINIPSDKNEKTSDLPTQTGKGSYALARIEDTDYIFVIISKINTSCGHIDYSGEVSDERIRIDYGPDFFNQKRLTNRSIANLIQATYPNEKIRSAGYLVKPPKIIANNQTYIGAVSQYILDNHTVLSVDLSTIHKNTLIIYSVTLDATGKEFKDKEAMEALVKMANETIILK